MFSPVVLSHVKPAPILPIDWLQEMQVDQAALTGESLPVTIMPGEKLKMGSAIKRGEVRC